MANERTMTDREALVRFELGDRVRKTKGSSWQGRIVGTYSTELTPIGYAVESEREPGSVQIYPGTALEMVDRNPPHTPDPGSKPSRTAVSETAPVPTNREVGAPSAVLEAMQRLVAESEGEPDEAVAMHSPWGVVLSLGDARAFVREIAPDDGGWRPIAEAPRGEDILVAGISPDWGPDHWWQTMAWLDPDASDPLDDFEYRPTHYRSLPAPPAPVPTTAEG